MEIPYTVTARPDTGLWNAKIGIWLFLASEVMLFGGLFSSYIFLRVGADYPWPVGVQKVHWGFINTLVLILSSVTVVFAWASLKMRKYNHFRIYMAITLICALGFLGIKAVEYNGKLTHWSLRTHDGSVVTGHVALGDDDNYIFSDVSVLQLDTAKTDFSYFTNYIADEDWKSVTVTDKDGGPIRSFGEVDAEDKPISKDDEAVTLGDEDVLERYLSRKNAAGIGTVGIELSKPVRFSMSRRTPTNYSLEEGSKKASVLFRDGTTASGMLENNAVTLEVDEVDLQALNLKKVKDGDIRNAKAFDYLGDAVYEEFIKHRDEVHAHFLEKHPNILVDKDDEVRRKALKFGLLEMGSKIHPRAGFGEHPTETHPTSEGGGEMGEGEGHGGHEHASVTFHNEDIKFYSNFSSRLNTYYAIYFLLTGLHGLHVIGGIIVLGYFFLFGKKLYDKDPEHMANRVEVGGLFWHFVDLVWIFLFPILYLM